MALITFFSWTDKNGLALRNAGPYSLKILFTVNASLLRIHIERAFGNNAFGLHMRINKGGFQVFVTKEDLEL